MYLKRLEMQGFKSFAEKIKLDFNCGITAVVGPNGSGKSNIADAIRWVLGEQSVKTLRGSKMEDVIFAGTEHRKPLGFAEVTIVLDNSDSTLPIDYEEVAITRRVYRSGESEYLINKTNCRLKDITELLLDTGIGRDGYSVIGQGRIDEILSTRSEDRRQIFEEASGIMKYKVRKHDAEKKLELTRQNLERINDIIAELESQLEPLREQSEKARRFLDLREELKVLEVNVYLDSMKKFRDRLEVMDKQLKTVQDQINDENNKLDEITRSNKEKTDLLKSMDERLEEAKQLFYEMEGNLERCSSEIKLNQEKIANLMQNIERLDTEKAELREKIEVLETEEAGKKDRLKYLERQLEEYSAKLAGFEKQMEELLKTLDEEERSIELLKSEIMDKMDIQSDKKLQISNLRSHIENMQKRQRSIDTEVYQNVVEKDREKMKKEELTESIRNAEQHIKGHKEKLSGLFREREETDKMLSELRMKQAKINSDIQSKSSRVRTLREMEQKLEGYNRSVREVLQACHASPQFGRGIHGALAQLIEVDRKYETAIEISLGGALQNIVTQTEEDAKKAIEFLKRNKLGRATFLPISSVEGRGFDNQTMARIKQCEGFCGVASELVSHDSVYTGIIRNLLGKVVVIDNLDNGIKMARKFRYSFRIVTLDGDLLNTGGAMSGGSLENRGTGILTRNREISELDEELKSLRQQETGVSKDIKQLTEDISRIDSDISSIENEIKNNELVKIRDESHLAQTDENLEKLTARMEMLRQEKEQLEREIKETGNELTKYELELLQIEEEISEAKKTVAEFQEKHKEDQAARDALHTDITDYKISVNSIKESIAGVNESSDRIHTEKENMVMSITKKESEQERFREEIKKLEEQIEGLNARIKKHSEERSGRSFEIDRLTEERKILEEDIYDIVNKINDTNKTILLLQEEYSRTEVRKTRLEAEMEALQDRIWNEYELTYSSAMELKKDVGSLTSAQRRINEIKNMIKELGPINVAAIDDYIKTKDRYEFMTNQRNDMEQAREKLLRVIAEMTSIMKKQFLEQFKLINKNFNDVFRELFNGGRASLTLVDEENVLESGIEIEAQPPGKKLQNMMLLSGGERAFTAIALLFAILRLKPSPFCVLDEIEAALDEANVYRFVEYLKNYSCNTQFIVVTHRKGTMEGSDMLYGVTMQEHGVSKIISMKMGEKVG
ncbi:MAG TPA: chromosome segregation protein SMC [Clostridiales bacterium]|nr:chromosome segregation protein SMC [Clostridiales bacterium]